MRIFTLIFTLVFFSGCATPTVTKTVKAGDDRLSCGQLINEFEDTNQLISEAQNEKGWTGGNIARGLLFWPAIIGTHQNANEAIAAAETRKVSLMNIMRTKKCDGIDRLN